MNHETAHQDSRTHGHDGDAGPARVRSRGIGGELGDGRRDLRLHSLDPVGEVVPAVEADRDQAPCVGRYCELNLEKKQEQEKQQQQQQLALSTGPSTNRP